MYGRNEVNINYAKFENNYTSQKFPNCNSITSKKKLSKKNINLETFIMRWQEMWQSQK